MIIGLHHISLAYSDLEAGIQNYRKLLGLEPSARSEEDGVECAYFALKNSAIRIVSARGHGPAAERIRQKLQSTDGALVDLAFLVADADQARQRLKRISLWPGNIQEFTVPNLLRPDSALTWKILEFDNALSNGVNIQFVQAPTPLPASSVITDPPISRTELFVVQTADPERALGLYAGRFDLKLLFDRTNADTGNRLIQLECGDVLFEISHAPAANTPDKPDSIWGIGWSVVDADATRSRLSNLGLNVSPVKDGAKPGTRVFTVRDGTCNIPTLAVQHVQPSAPIGL